MCGELVILRICILSTYPNWFGITGYPEVRSPVAKGKPAVKENKKRDKKKGFEFRVWCSWRDEGCVNSQIFINAVLAKGEETGRQKRLALLGSRLLSLVQ